MVTAEQERHYREEGYVKVEGLFSPEEVGELGSEMVRIINEWGQETIGWHGPWRERYLKPEEQQTTKAVFLHNPQHYSATWGRILFHEGLTSAIGKLVAPTMQWHHTVLHAKPPTLGTPFPMHQDYPFYPHEYPHPGRDFIDCLVHLDDAPPESGCLHVVPKSHLGGPIEHITGSHTAPHLPPNDYHPDKIETVEIPAKAGDVIFFSYTTIHWSDCNRTDNWRRSVRIGFHEASMRPVGKDPAETYHNTIATGFKSKPEEAAAAS